MFVAICWQNSNCNWWSFYFSSCTICSLYRWNFKSTRRIWRTHSPDNLTAAASLRAERRGLRKTEMCTASTFCGVRALLGRPVGFFFRADPVTSKFLIQVFIACFEGTRPWCPKLKKMLELPLRTFQTIIVFVKHFYGESMLLTVPLIHDYLMARLSVAQGPCSAVLPTVHGCHYAFKKFLFFCVTLYNYW